jgi:hypothetical protein
MARTQKIIHVDEEDWNSMPSGERSEIIRKFMKDYNNAIKGNLNDINLELLKVQIVTLENQKVKIDTELQSKKVILENALKIQEEDRLKQLEVDKQKLEDANKCICCKKILQPKEKRHKFTKGLVCNACFMVNATKENILLWSMEAV